MSQAAAVQTVEHPDWRYLVCVCVCVLKELEGGHKQRIKIIEVLRWLQVITTCRRIQQCEKQIFIYKD